MQTEAQKRAQRKYRETEKFRVSMHNRDQRRHEKLRARRQRLLEQFGNRCYVCERTPRYLAFHHLSYNGDSVKGNGRHEQEKILDEVEKNPENFRLSCSPCHSVVTTLMKNPECLPRLLECAKLQNPLEPPQKV